MVSNKDATCRNCLPLPKATTLKVHQSNSRCLEPRMNKQTWAPEKKSSGLRKAIESHLYIPQSFRSGMILVFAFTRLKAYQGHVKKKISQVLRKKVEICLFRLRFSKMFSVYTKMKSRPFKIPPV